MQQRRGVQFDGVVVAGGRCRYAVIVGWFLAAAFLRSADYMYRIIGLACRSGSIWRMQPAAHGCADQACSG